MNKSEQEPRRTKLFRNNRTQAVRIPASMELDCEFVFVHREGLRLIIEPASTSALLEVLQSIEPLTGSDCFPDVKASEPALEDVNFNA